MEEPKPLFPSEIETPAPTPRPCSTPHSAPIAWLRSAGKANPPDPDALRVAIGIVLGSTDAIAEVIERAPAIRAAQAKARPQVADGILERSITGTVEHYYRDGVLVGERRGIAAINQAGGITIAQSELGRRHFDMPASAIDLGRADVVIPPAKIAGLLIVAGGLMPS